MTEVFHWVLTLGHPHSSPCDPHSQNYSMFFEKMCSKLCTIYSSIPHTFSSGGNEAEGKAGEIAGCLWFVTSCPNCCHDRFKTAKEEFIQPSSFWWISWHLFWNQWKDDCQEAKEEKRLSVTWIHLCSHHESWRTQEQ